MSDPEVPQPERPKDVDDVVDSANAGLDAAAAAAAGTDAPVSDADAADADATDADAPVADTPVADTPVADAEAAASTAQAAADVDPDLAAFEEAEKAHPGTFSTPELNAMTDADDEPTSVIDAPVVHEESAMAGAAYAATADAETRIVPSEPVPSGPIVAPVQQPIFVQAPEPPRERGNRGTAAGIGLLATLAFAVLFLGAILGLGALAGEVTGENIAEAALAPLTTWGFWTPVVVFFLGFWLLGAFINRGRWGLWVVFGIIVGVIAYGGYILGQLFEAPFWLLTASEGAELVGSVLLHPLAIAAFVFGRELTIWFGAWVSRSGARKTELNAEAQREYERTLEAGPTLSR